jgi:hypothetical protein
MLTPAARQAIDQCYAYLGAQPDSFRGTWNNDMQDADRRLFLMAARLPGAWHNRLWDQFQPSHQMAIKAAANRLRAVVDRIFSAKGGA